MSKFVFNIASDGTRLPCFVARGDKVLSIAQDGSIVRDAFCVTPGPVNQFIQDAHYPDGYGIGEGTSKIDLFYKTCTNETGRGTWTECSLPVPIPSLGGEYVQVSEDSAFAEPMQYDADVAWTMVFNLIPGRRYYWRVLGIDGAVIRAGRFDTNGTVRMIRLEGVRNVRDPGGFACDGGTIAYNRLWRGNHTDDASLSDIAEFKRWGFTAQLDLRSKSKQYTGSDLGLTYYGSVYSGTTLKSDRYGIDCYAELLANPGNLLNCINAILTELEAGGGIYFHCKYGSDRTGSLGAILMGLLGCTEDAIIKFWELTSCCGYLNTKRIHKQDYTNFPKGEMRDMLKYLHQYYGGDEGLAVAEQIQRWFRNKVCSSLSDNGAGLIERLRKCLVVPNQQQ